MSENPKEINDNAENNIDENKQTNKGANSFHEEESDKIKSSTRKSEKYNNGERLIQPDEDPTEQGQDNNVHTTEQIGQVVKEKSIKENKKRQERGRTYLRKDGFRRK